MSDKKNKIFEISQDFSYFLWNVRLGENKLNYSWVEKNNDSGQ